MIHIHEIVLSGCTPEPLMAYLKSLGILRLVSEQVDPNARGWWKNDVFCLQSSLDDISLVQFFIEDYRPTPIVVPWSGGDFFGVNWQEPMHEFEKTPTSSKAIEAILATESERFISYRRVLHGCRIVLQRCGIHTKENMGKRKWAFIRELRSTCDELQLIEWMDAATIGTVEKFAALLGSGGGSDGNTHFSDNFMQNLWDVLPDFDSQRKPKKRVPDNPTVVISCELLRNTLFKSHTHHLIENRTSSLYDSGAVGGPNASQGVERNPLSNPWNVILALEGTISLAGAASKRLAGNVADAGAFPFQVSVAVTARDGLADKEGAGSEIWLPLWTRPTKSNEVSALLREGRAQCGLRPAKTGVDMARSITSLGIDRGIGAFGRYAILKGRVGGENYNTATSLGRFYAMERTDVDLLREVDGWLDEFRRKCAVGRKKEEAAPKRILSTLHAIDSAVFEFCKYGGSRLFQNIVVALGRAERELAITQGKFRTETVAPIQALSADWLEAADDGSVEYELATALAHVRDPQKKIPAFRANLELVRRNGKWFWAEKDRRVVWNSTDLSANLCAVLERRLRDGEREGCEQLPIAPFRTARLAAVARFLSGTLDEKRLEELLWGTILIKPPVDEQRTARDSEQTDPIPRSYALLKHLFLPRPHSWENNEEIRIRPEPSILPLLRANRIAEACAVAARRLRSSGLIPMPYPMKGRPSRDTCWEDCATDWCSGVRLAAALLIPISPASMAGLSTMVLRKDATAKTAEGGI